MVLFLIETPWLLVEGLLTKFIRKQDREKFTLQLLLFRRKNLYNSAVAIFIIFCFLEQNRRTNLEGVTPLCGKIIYLLLIYNIFRSTKQYYGIFT